MYSGKYYGRITTGYSGYDAFRIAAALNYFKKQNGGYGKKTTTERYRMPYGTPEAPGCSLISSMHGSLRIITAAVLQDLPVMTVS